MCEPLGPPVPSETHFEATMKNIIFKATIFEHGKKKMFRVAHGSEQYKGET